MYISINRKMCQFLHKHPDFKVVCNLDFIAQKHEHTDVMPMTDGTHLVAGWTDMELSMLYRNITGQQNVPYMGTALRAVIAEYAERFPVTDCFPGEAELQAQYVEDKPPTEDEEDYEYVKGAKIPAQKSSLWGKLVRVALLPPGEAANIVQQRITAQAKRIAALTHVHVAPAAPSAPAQAPAKREVSAPRSGVCKQIWESLDAEHMRISEIPTRDFIKKLAVERGWNASTASVQYAAWRKSKG